MRSKTKKKDFEFAVPVTKIKNQLEAHSTKLIGNILVIGTGYDLTEATQSEEKYGVKLSHIIWQDTNLLPLAQLIPSMQPFLHEVLEMANNQCANILFKQNNSLILTA